jgi:LETM1 and EF-hand domain-containing protein 1, mitochondrial
MSTIFLTRLSSGQYSRKLYFQNRNGQSILRVYSSLHKNHDEDLHSTLSETIRSLTTQGLPDKIPPKSLQKTPIITRLKEGLQHYWHGSKLLAYETKISTRLIYKIMKGEHLIRREKRQLLRTTSDLLRLVPFVVIAVIPFLEFALPLILKIFPNMLPSTFEDQLAAVYI